MCNFFSCIVTRDKKVIWDKSTTSHNELIEKFNLYDNKLNDRDFVRIEITPKSGKITKNKKDWIYKEDEDSTLPNWYKENKEKIESKVWKEWRKALEIQVAINENKEFNNCIVYAYGNSNIKTYGNSSVILYDNSTAKLYDDSSAELYNETKATLFNNSVAKLYDNSTAKLYDNSSAELNDKAIAELYDNSALYVYSKNAKFKIMSLSIIVLTSYIESIISLVSYTKIYRFNKKQLGKWYKLNKNFNIVEAKKKTKKKTKRR